MDSTTHTASKLVNNKYICKDIYVIFFYDQAQLYIRFLISSLNKYKLQNLSFSLQIKMMYIVLKEKRGLN